MKNYFVAVWIAMLLVSCKKEGSPVKEPDPLSNPPETTATLSRSFNYTADQVSAAVSYPVSMVRTAALHTGNGSLLITFDTDYPNGRDNFSIVLPAAGLKPGYVGEYPILQASAPQNELTYFYRLTESASNRWFPGAAQGVLKITSYNDLFKTLTGTIAFTITTNTDPVEAPPKPARPTVIAVVCTFEHLGIK